MRILLCFIWAFIIIFYNNTACGQKTFDPQDYYQRLENNKALDYEQVSAIYPTGLYYEDRIYPVDPNNYLYFDSIVMKYGITDEELDMLTRNKFMITERLSEPTMIEALDEIFHHDLPVFISTDIILNTLHISYDNILMDLEFSVLQPNLINALGLMRDNLPLLIAKYKDNPALENPLKDVDIYLTIALSLSDSTTHQSLLADQCKIDTLLNAIYSEAVTIMPLFSERKRYLDFSQFKPRGHYTTSMDFYSGSQSLSKYFRTMMWFGRMEFYLTPPPDFPEWTKEEIRRMHLGAFILQELLEISGAYDKLLENEQVITFMVGESDNLTPWEYHKIIQELIPGNNAGILLADSIFDPYFQAVKISPEAEQKILSSILFANPFDPEPEQLPVSYRVMGQRFIIDSYVFSNVVYDRVPSFRMMPDPLDAMFVLGNNNALPLLKNQIDHYKYSPQLDALRYLVDSYDEYFWGSSLYNTWLQSLRELNPVEGGTDYPYFMTTTAWQHQKLNTQLASWAQLRHDNLLYAKQSYTWGVICSFPHSFIEPYPEFYKSIEKFCDAAYSYFHGMKNVGYRITMYFNNVRNIMQKLSTIAEKELQKEPLNDEEITFLKGMLREPEMVCGAPPYAGWLTYLYYNEDKLSDEDYVIADVHTQPTDEWGNMVGKILHVGTGKINLGIILTGSPSGNYSPVAFIGPFMSYYEQVTDKFLRRTDESWTVDVLHNYLPERPSWTNIYLLDENGNPTPGGLRLQGTLYGGVEGIVKDNGNINYFNCYPNPAKDQITFNISTKYMVPVELNIYDVYGRLIINLLKVNALTEPIEITWTPYNISEGIYFAELITGNQKYSVRIIII